MGVILQYCTSIVTIKMNIFITISSETGECIGEFLHAQEDVALEEDCLKVCKETRGCKWFTHVKNISTCLLMSDCDQLDETCLDCASGEERCQEGTRIIKLFSLLDFYSEEFKNLLNLYVSEKKFKIETSHKKRNNT